MKRTGCAQRDVVESQNDKNQLGYRKECELLIRVGRNANGDIHLYLVSRTRRVEHMNTHVL
jgi:hypothetical protein